MRTHFLHPLFAIPVRDWIREIAFERKRNLIDAAGGRVVIGVNGVKDHLKNIYSILEVSSRTEAATLADNLDIFSI